MSDVATDPRLEKDFIPQIVLNSEYEHFFTNMKYFAEVHEARRDAVDAAARRGGRSNLSGVWKMDAGAATTARRSRRS